MLHLNKINTCLFKLALLISCTLSYLIIDSWCRERGKEGWGRRKREREGSTVSFGFDKKSLMDKSLLFFSSFFCIFISLSVIGVVDIVQYHILLCAFIFFFFLLFFWGGGGVGWGGGEGGSRVEEQG